MIEGYVEIPDTRTLAVYDRLDYSALRKRIFAALVDQGYPGTISEDFSIIPRILPASYLAIIEDACRSLTLPLLRLASMDRRFILERLFPDPRWKELIEQHGILDHVPRRMVGEIRYDFAICGPVAPDNPPQLLEVNAGALGCIVYASLLPRLIKQFVPDLDHVEYLDLAQHFAELCGRVGPHVANLSLGAYSWGEDVLEQAFGGRERLHLVSPIPPGCGEQWPKLKQARLTFAQSGKLQFETEDITQELDGFRWSRVLEEEDVRRYGALLRAVQDSRTVFLSPLRLDFIGHKGVLPLLGDEGFLKNHLGVADAAQVTRFVPRTVRLSDVGFPAESEWERLVLKGNFGCSGKNVFVGDAIAKMAGRIDRPRDWVLQERLELNQMLSRFLYRGGSRPVRMDLGVFVHYDYEDGELRYFKVAGALSRGSDKLRVNLNLGGAAIAVMFAVGTDGDSAGSA